MTAQQLPHSSGPHRAARPSGRRAAVLEITAPGPGDAAWADAGQARPSAPRETRPADVVALSTGRPEVEAMGAAVAWADSSDALLRGSPAASADDVAGDDSATGLVLEGPGRRVVLVSSDRHLLSEMTAVCAAAEAQLSRARGLSAAQLDGAGAASAQLLLLDARDLRAAATRPGPFDAPSVLLGTADDMDLWELAARVGDCTVAMLPDAEPWLADRLADLQGDASRAAAGVLGVLGAVGGAGASTLSCWLAAAAARERDVVLVDGDPEGCGIDLLLGTELEPALRWPDLVGSHGALSSRRLWDVLPMIEGHEGMRWLSWDRRGEDEAPVPAVLRTLRRACDAVVLDLGSPGERSFQLASQCDAVVVVVPRTVRALLCARRAAEALSGTPVEFALAGPAIADVEPGSAAEILGLRPLVGLPFDPGVPEACELRGLLERGARRRHASAVASLWGQLDELHALLAQTPSEPVGAAGRGDRR